MNALQADFDSIRSQNPNADWIEPSLETEGLGRNYKGSGIFTAQDTQHDTIIVFLAQTEFLTFDDVSASFAAIGYNRDGTLLDNNTQM